MEQMNITSAQYCNDKLTDEANVNIKATIDGQVMYVSLDPANRNRRNKTNRGRS